MLNSLCEYKEKLERGIKEYMSQSVNERTACAVGNMVECLQRIECAIEKRKGETFNEEDIVKWNEHMENEDGTRGGHWSVSETTAVANNAGITFENERCFNVCMNMMYSDYYPVAIRYNVNSPDFYAMLANCFLKDKDAKQNKLAEYYHHIVK